MTAPPPSVDPPQPVKIGAAVVTFRPPDGFREILDALLEEFPVVFLVHNGTASDAPTLDPRDERRHRLRPIVLGENRGMAAALNAAAIRALEEGMEWLTAFDQDSRPRSGFLAVVKRTLRDYPWPNRLAVLGTQPVDPELRIAPKFVLSRGRVWYRRRPCDSGRIDNVLSVIAAGSTYRLSVWRELGGFREDYFLDYFDTEYCLRAATRSYAVAVACEASIEHRLGRRARAGVGRLTFYPTFHSPERWYYLGRNRVAMIERYGWRIPAWLSYEIVATGYGLVRMLLFENDRRRKLAALWLGTRDGLLGRTGKAPAYRVLAEGT